MQKTSAGTVSNSSNRSSSGGDPSERLSSAIVLLSSNNFCTGKVEAVKWLLVYILCVAFNSTKG